MRRYLFVATVVSAALCLALTCNPKPDPVDPGSVDAGAEDAGADGRLPPSPGATACERACNRMDLLSCPGHEGSPAGAPCEEVCEHTESSGVGSFCPDDVAQIQGTALVDGGRACDEDELQRAFEACL